MTRRSGIHEYEWKQQILRGLLLLSVLLSANSCSDRAMSVFFDVPPPTPEELAAKAEAEAKAEARAERLLAAARSGQDLAAITAEEEAQPAADPPPKIESATSWDEAEALLPKDRDDRRGRPDWTEAVREGVIKPRDSVDGSPRPAGQVFLYDFFIPGNDPGFEAYFPHSTHTEWMSCESCHPKIFPVRGAKMTKDEIKDGKYCGVCHKNSDDGPAFWLKACDRCHLLAKD